MYFQNPIFAEGAYFAAEVRVHSQFSVAAGISQVQATVERRECAVLEEVSIRLCHVDEPALKARNGCLSFSVGANLFRRKGKKTSWQIPDRHRLSRAFT